MTEPSPISSLGDLTKPATVLIEKISDAVGAVFRPLQIVRLAKAEAAAALIRAESEWQITELQKRGFNRLVEEEGKKQANIESITRMALPQLDPAADPSRVENDWITNFFDKCRLTSDEDLQTLWARVLAGEANAPGSFCRRTVNFLASLDKADAEQFTALCSFAWSISGVTELVPLVFDPQIEIYTSHGVRFTSLNHLESIGLIHFERVAGFRKAGLKKFANLSYFGKHLRLNFQNEADNYFDIGHVQLTRTGAELAPICGAEANDQFFEYVMQKWQREGCFSPADGSAPPITVDAVRMEVDADSVIYPEVLHLRQENEDLRRTIGEVAPRRLSDSQKDLIRARLAPLVTQWGRRPQISIFWTGSGDTANYAKEFEELLESIGFSMLRISGPGTYLLKHDYHYGIWVRHDSKSAAASELPQLGRALVAVLKDAEVADVIDFDFEGHYLLELIVGARYRTQTDAQKQQEEVYTPGRTVQ